MFQSDEVWSEQSGIPLPEVIQFKSWVYRVLTHTICTGSFSSLHLLFGVAVLDFNPYKPSVPFLGHRQAVQTWSDAASDQGLHCLLTGISIRNSIKNEKVHLTPLKFEMDSSNWKGWMGPLGKCGLRWLGTRGIWKPPPLHRVLIKTLLKWNA